ncbi:MAG TPA: sigma-70 family RNA polymerase sigma factor, partial [Polyangiaceae bacterium]|nr:sigma-70 family RNA polymerase sigma factor [Polyangiaceae bacterium]
MTALTKFDELPTYVVRAQREPVLERVEELELARRFREHGDRAAAERLTRAHLRVVVSIAHKYRRYGIPLADLIAEGNFGLAQALNKFEPERGLRFVTYASYWIRAFVLDHVIRSWSMVGAGAGALRSRVFFRLRRERTRIANTLGTGEEADRVLAERLGLGVDTVRNMMQRLDSRDVSLERESSAGESQLRLLDTLQSNDNQERDVLTREVEASVSSAVGRAVAELDARERYIAERRLMADPSEELSLAEIGRELGVSRERARQLETRTKTKLKLRIPALGG